MGEWGQEGGRGRWPSRSPFLMGLPAAFFASFVRLESMHVRGRLSLRASSKDPAKWVISFLSFIRFQI